MGLSLAAPLKATLACYRTLLAEAFGARLRQLRLYGSQARGDASEDSDADVALILDRVDDDDIARAAELGLKAWRDAGGSGPVPSPLLLSSEEYDARLRAGRRLALDIAREGVPL